MSLQTAPSPKESSSDASCYLPLLRAIVGRSCANHTDRLYDDFFSAASLGLTKALKALEQDPEGDQGGERKFVASCINNSIRDMLRKKHNSKQLPCESDTADWTSPYTWGDVPGDRVDLAKRRESLMELLDDPSLLTDNERAVITSMWIGHTQTEISSMLKLSEPTISRNKHSAIAKLRSAVRGQLPVAA